MKDAWIIWFEDASESPLVFNGEGAEEAAHRTFEKKLRNWSCHLFQKIELKPELIPQEPCGHEQYSWEYGSIGHEKRCRACGIELDWIGYSDEEMGIE